MFKVICLDDAERSTDECGNTDWDIKAGDTYTVCDEFESEDGIMCYSLEEDPEKEEFGWAQDRFARLSDISETEMSREYNFKSIEA